MELIANHHSRHLEELASEILSDLMQFRRTYSKADNCSVSCDLCHQPHLNKIYAAIYEQRPITFILPAFPGKSPNTSKVLGHLPDLGETLSLEFLESFCQRVKKYYPPGAHLILCSDGRVFSDAVGIDEEHISSYQKEIDQIIKDKKLNSITTFNLDDVFSNLDFNGMREKLMRLYGRELDELKLLISEGKSEEASMTAKEAHRLYCGMTRFLFEDSLTPNQTQSRASLQKSARLRSYEVIRRSNAWGELLKEIFPEAVRLSIHPQECGSEKIGIRLLEGENWMTPWHGVALLEKGTVKLVKRSEAESIGASLQFINNRPSHYLLEGNRT